MPHYTTPPLPKDANGDVRYPSESAWPVKARCVRCSGHCKIRPFINGEIRQEFIECPSCNGRGYYFLPLGL
jgi:hypothetical protein